MKECGILPKKMGNFHIFTQCLLNIFKIFRTFKERVKRKIFICAVSEKRNEFDPGLNLLGISVRHAEYYLL